jgi:hypothetical protein
MFAVMKLVMIGVTPYSAASRYQIAVATVYRSYLYKLWRKGTPEALAELKRTLDIERPEPVEKKTKEQRFLERIKAE